MINMHVALVVGVIGLTPVYAAPRGLQEPRISHRRPALPASPLLAAPARDPFREIFVVPQLPRTPAQPLLRSTQKPRVVCGTVVVPANPNLDPKMILDLPPKPNVEHKMRVLSSQICRE